MVRPSPRRIAARHRPAAVGAPASACTSTCRSAPAAAATATSTPTRPPSWAAVPAARGTPTPSWPSWRSPPGCWATARRPGSTPSSSAVERPTLLPADDLARILDGIDRTWGLAADAEVTTEANPESVTPESLKLLRAAGFTRISLGMQSAAPGVLAVLDRRHSAGRAAAAALEARDAGFEHVNLDLIYGTPGERHRGLRRLAGAGRRGRGGPRQRVRADRRGRHPARRPDAARRAAVPRVTTWPRTATWPPRPRSTRPGSPGTRCPTGPAPTRPAAGTTCSTGPAATGGASGRARTATSAGCAGGT